MNEWKTNKGGFLFSLVKSFKEWVRVSCWIVWMERTELRASLTISLYQPLDEWTKQHSLLWGQIPSLLLLCKNGVLEDGKYSRENRQKIEEVNILKNLQWAHTTIPASYLFCTPIWYFTLHRGRKKLKFLTADYLLPCGPGDKAVWWRWCGDSAAQCTTVWVPLCEKVQLQRLCRFLTYRLIPTRKRLKYIAEQFCKISLLRFTARWKWASL